MGIKFNNKNLLLSNAASEHTTASGGPEDPSSEGAVVPTPEAVEKVTTISISLAVGALSYKIRLI